MLVLNLQNNSDYLNWPNHVQETFYHDGLNHLWTHIAPFCDVIDLIELVAMIQFCIVSRDQEYLIRRLRALRKLSDRVKEDNAPNA